MTSVPGGEEEFILNCPYAALSQQHDFNSWHMKTSWRALRLPR